MLKTYHDSAISMYRRDSAVVCIGIFNVWSHLHTKVSLAMLVLLVCHSMTSEFCSGDNI